MGKDYGCRATKFSARQVLTNAEFRNFVGDELVPWPGCQADLEWQTSVQSLPFTFAGATDCFPSLARSSVTLAAHRFRRGRAPIPAATSTFLLTIRLVCSETSG